MVPISLVTVDDEGKTEVKNDLVLEEREAFVPLDTSRPFKLNFDTTGFCALPFCSFDILSS